jgi:hypothetical protein
MMRHSVISSSGAEAISANDPVAFTGHDESLCVVVKRQMTGEVLELVAALAKFRVGARSDVDPIRMLELYEGFCDSHHEYWAAMAVECANQAVRPVCVEVEPPD